MDRAVRAKFDAHGVLRDLLVGTGDVELAEGVVKDWYWGVGPDGTGENRLGVLLMRLRDELREAVEADDVA